MINTTVKLNHINLPVTDVAAGAAFFKRYFNFKTVEVKGDNMLTILEGADGFILVLMADTFNRNGNSTYPDAFHIGFLVDTHAEVSRIHKSLINAELTNLQPPGNLRGGFGFYFNAPGNILTEVTCLLKN